MNETQSDSVFPNQVVVAFPGMVMNTTWAFLRGLEAFRKDIGQGELHVFLHTWNAPVNRGWIELIKKQREDETPNIKLHFVVEDFNSKEMMEYFGTIYKETTGRFNNNVHEKVIKLFTMWYSLQNISKRINEYDPNAIVVKVRTALNFDVAQSPDYGIKVKDSIRHIRFKLKNRYKSLVTGFEAIRSPEVGSGYITETVFLSTSAILSKMLGQSSNALAMKFVAYLFKEFNSKNFNPLGRGIDLGQMILHKMISTEGANVFHFLAEEANIPYTNDTQTIITRFNKKPFPCNSPMLYIEDGEVMQQRDFPENNKKSAEDFYFLGNVGYVKHMPIYD